MGGEKGLDDGGEGAAVRHPPEAVPFEVGDGNAAGLHGRYDLLKFRRLDAPIQAVKSGERREPEHSAQVAGWLAAQKVSLVEV